MQGLESWLGDINTVEGLSAGTRGILTIVASVLCGSVIGLERESRDKPAGLRTVILICVGSTIFTVVSLLISDKPTADPARIAAQVAPGIGFLGAGAIIHARGTVLGLTTGATIWAVAAVGVTVGAGYVVAGIVFTSVIFLTLTVVHRLERIVLGNPVAFRLTVTFRPEGGKTRARLLYLLDRYGIESSALSPFVDRDLPEDQEGVELRARLYARDHREFANDVAELPGVETIDVMTS